MAKLEAAVRILAGACRGTGWKPPTVDEASGVGTWIAQAVTSRLPRGTSWTPAQGPLILAYGAALVGDEAECAEQMRCADRWFNRLLN